MATPDNKNQAGSEKPASTGSDLERGENVGKTTRSKAKKVLEKGSNIPPPREPEPETPKTREGLIDHMGLRGQHADRADAMIHLIDKGAFELGKEIPPLQTVLDSFTLEQLQLATTLQEPTLLLVPETSFAAKVRALDARKTRKGQKDCYVDEIFKRSDADFGKIAGWKAVIVDGARDMRNHGAANGDGDLGLSLEERIAIRKAA
ncbi:hypothetical protein HZA44_04010, partial [Candidatus Peregrinibacteria bacterium]|nr:hypothetical protein [Candidatus Peregrinibacteria bacterium]